MHNYLVYNVACQDAKLLLLVAWLGNTANKIFNRCLARVDMLVNPASSTCCLPLSASSTSEYLGGGMISEELASPQIGDGTSGTGLWLGPALQPPGTSLPEMPNVGWTKLRGAEVNDPDAAARAKTRSLERAISCR